MPLFELPLHHPEFPERVTLISETWLNFVWAGAGHGLYSVAYSNLIPSTSEVARVVNICLIVIIFAAGSWKTFSPTITRDFRLHYRCGASRTYLLFLDGLRMGGMLYARSFGIKHISKFSAPLFYLTDSPSYLLSVIYRSFVLWAVWRIIPEIAVVSSRVFTIPKFIARILGVIIEVYQDNERKSKASHIIQSRRLGHANLPRNYKYSPILTPRTIRLLRLQSINGKANCSLKIVTLDEAPSFWALSYQWGSEEKPMLLKITTGLGRREYISITKNCASAIQALIPVGVRHLWIDAICINQSDDIEKEHQIPLMGEIYSEAALVVGHLCTDNIYSIGLLIHKMVQTLGNGKEFDISYAAGPQIFRALGALYKHPYFERAWIVQEMVLAKSLILIYGKDCIHFEHLMVIARGQSKDLIKPGGSIPLGDTNSLQVRKLNIWNDFIMSIAAFRERGTVVDKLRLILKEKDVSKRLTTAEIVDANTPMGATNSRDQIYALLSLASDSTVAELQPNYSHSISNKEIFTKICRYYLEDGKHLNLFLSAGISPRVPLVANEIQIERTPGLPSWVHDFTSGSSRVLRLGNWAVDIERARNASLTCRFPPNNNILMASGTIIDYISVTTAPIPMPPFPDGVSHPLLAGTEGMKYITATMNATRDMVETFTAETYADNTPRNEAYWRTMLMDRFLAQSPAPAEAAPVLNMVREMAPFLFTNNSSVLREQCRIKSLSDMTPEKTKLAVDSIMLSITRIWMPYTFMLTKLGFMGWAPHGVRVGDLVVLFEGCGVPFVLRPMGGEGEGEGEGEEFALWGDAYLHGFLPGQGLGVRDRSRRWFKIV